MRKLKYILASLILVTGLVSCDTEAIDEKVKDESSEGKPILRFVFNNKQTVVTDDIKVKMDPGITIEAKLSIPNTGGSGDPFGNYKAATLFITLSDLMVANYPTSVNIDNPTNLMSYALLQVQELDEEGKKIWVEYATTNAKEGQDAGYTNVTGMNAVSKYINGNFEYILYPEDGVDLTPQSVTDGAFYYVNY